MPKIMNQTNILDPLAREVKYTSARNRFEVLADLQYDAIAYDVKIYLNNNLQLGDFEVKDTDIIVVQIVPKGGGGGLLRTVAMIGIAIAAAYTGGAAASAMGFTATATPFAYAATIGIVGGAVTMAGSSLVNALLPMGNNSVNLSNNNLSESSVYSWDSAYNKSQQGTAIPKVFGTAKVVPPLISKYVESINDKQYFHGLYALNDGQITNVSNIKINDESIANFDNVTVNIRYGTNNQKVVPDFATTRIDKNVNQKLSTDYDTTTSDEGITELTAVIYFPRGLYYMNDQAKVVSNSVKLIVEYSSDGINWYPMTSSSNVSTYSNYYSYDADNDTYSKYSSTGVFISLVSNLPSDAILLPNNTNTPIGTSSWAYNIYATASTYTAPYETITASSTSAFRKTYTKKYLTPATYQVRAKLYETPLSGSRYGSDVYFEYLEMGVNDGFIYPNTALLSIRALATDQLSGSNPVITCEVTANSNNPSLICQSILNEVSDVTSFDSSFNDFETECNTQNYKCNIVFDSSINVRQALDLVSLNGRASIQQFGSKYAVIMDKKDVLPVQKFTFGMGNILENTFTQSYLPINDRANIIQVSYYDKNDNYNRTVVEISNANYDNVVDRKIAELNLIGCVDRQQAINHANYQLKCNRYLSETVQFEAFHDSLVCKYGDIVAVSHDLPQYGYSGRIISCNASQIVLDKNVTFEIGKTYAVLLRNKNNAIQEITVTGTGTTNTLTVAETLSYTFELYDNYMFGEINKTSKLFRVINISTGSDLTRLITCLEYNADVYDDSSVVNIPVVSDLGLRSLFVSDYIRYKQDSNEIETVVNLKWTGVSLKYKIYLDNQFIGESNDTYFDYVTTLTGNHTFKIVDSNGKSISQIYNILGKLRPPSSVTNLNYSIDSDNITLTWDYDDNPIDFKQFNIYDELANLIATSNTNNVIIPIKKQKITLSVGAIDSSNVLSELARIDTSTPYLNDVENFTSYFNKNGEVELSWSLITSNYNPIEYEIRKGISWENAQIVGNVIDKFYKPNGQGNYFIKGKYTNIYGFSNYSENATSINITGDNLVKNVIFTADEKATLWNGTKTNCLNYNDLIYGESIILSPAANDIDLVDNFDLLSSVDYINGSVSNGIYELSTHSITLDYSQRLGIDLSYKVYGISLDDNIDLVDNFDLIANIDGDFSSEIKVTPQIKLDSGSWQNYILGDYVATTFEFRLLIETTNSRIIPVVTECKLISDVPDKIQQGTNVTVDTSGLSVIYDEAFNTDTVNIQITIINSQSGDYAIITADDREGFTVTVKNGASNVARNINWISQAY